jgi:hypothetical protein
MRKLVLLAFLSVTLFNICISRELKSPDGKFVMNFSLQENGTPSYTLAYKGKGVIKTSKLGLELKSDEQKSGAGNAVVMVQKSVNAKASFSEVISTKMNREDIAFQNNFLSTLNNVDQYKIKGNDFLVDEKEKIFCGLHTF